MVHPGIEVDQLRVHYGDSVVQAKQLRWKTIGGDRHAEFSASNTWLALEAEPLVDRRLHSNKIVIEDARIALIPASVEYASAPGQSRPHWQKGLADQIAQVTWQDLSSRFESVLAAKKIAERWSERLLNWQDESEAIVVESDEIAADLSDLANPLRDEEDLRSRLEALAVLEQRQARLISQFNGVREFLNAERVRLEASHGQEQGALAEFDVEQLANSVAQTSAELAEDILRELVSLAWSQHRDLLEGPARLALGPATPREIASSLDFEFDDAASVDLLDVSAHGLFRLTNESLPFVMHGKYATSSGIESYRWDYEFQGTEASTTVTVIQTSDSQTRTINLNQDSALPCSLTGTVSTSGEQIGGHFRLNPAELTLKDDAFTVKQVVESYSAVADSSGEPVSFRISGTWSSPNFEFEDTDLSWLRSEVHRRTRQTIQDRVIEASERASHDFESRLARMEAIVDQASVVHQRLAGKQVARLSDTRAELERRLQDIGEPILR
jgi:hypothetical protein